MTRIVAGTAKGRQLAVPKSGTRPTAERVREALFSSLEHWGYIEDSVVLDLFAGSGALGLEAASRGARQVTCVEMATPAVRVLRRNITSSGLECVTAVSSKADTYLDVAAGAIPVCDLVFVDPPYAYSEAALAQTLALLEPHVVSDGLVVVERDKRSPEPLWPRGWELCDERKCGDTKIWSARRSQS